MYMHKYRNLTAKKFDEITSGYAIHSDIMSEEIEKAIAKQKKDNMESQGSM